MLQFSSARARIVASRNCPPQATPWGMKCFNATYAIDRPRSGQLRCKLKIGNRGRSSRESKNQPLLRPAARQGGNSCCWNSHFRLQSRRTRAGWLPSISAAARCMSSTNRRWLPRFKELPAIGKRNRIRHCRYLQYRQRKPQRRNISMPMH